MPAPDLDLRRLARVSAAAQAMEEELREIRDEFGGGSTGLPAVNGGGELMAWQQLNAGTQAAREISQNMAHLAHWQRNRSRAAQTMAGVRDAIEQEADEGDEP